MNLILTVITTGTLYVVIRLVYNVFLHPLSRFPGPLANRASVFPKTFHLVNGTLPFHITDMHNKYGPIIRITPNELAFINPQAWRDIYARKPGTHELPHDMKYYNATDITTTSLLSSHRESHDTTRKLLAPGFSERALMAQEPVLDTYVSLLMKRLRENCTNSNGDSVPVDMTKWMAYTTFDLIGNLAFGSDFGCLSRSGYHPWVKLILGTVKNMSRIHALKALGILRVAIFFMRKLKVGERELALHVELTKSKTRQRVELGTGRNDFLDGLIKSGMAMDELVENGSLLIVAGSETSATLLTGALYLLTANPGVMEKLKNEVRGLFETEGDITLTTVNKLSYLTAVLKESLRCYPPVAGAAPRLTPKGGAEISGTFVPAGTTVSVWQWAAYHDSEYFEDPYSFCPERFANPGVGRHRNDRLDVVNPFLVGPRNCIGQNLAYAEMRLILARLIWAFDLQIGEDGKGWLEGQKNYLFWEKPPLQMYLTPV